MKLIVGLGNPGTKYAKTRHNTGRMLVDQIAEKYFKGKWMVMAHAKSLLLEGEWEGRRVTLVKPETFMNLSGESVKYLTQLFRAELSDLLIAVDESSIPFGTLRIRPSGSEGGHNGLRSIRNLIGSQNYPRLRIGIGPCPEGVPLEEFVLESFTTKEKKLLPGVLDKGMEACRLWLTQPFDRVMNAVNHSAA